MLKENFKIIIEADECVLMQNHIDSLEQIDKKLQQSSHVFDDPVACYMEGFINSKLQPLVEYKSENVDSDELLSKSAISFFPSRVSLQKFNTYLHLFHDNHQFDIYGSINVVGGMIQDDRLVKSPEINFISFQYPFAAFLETTNVPKFLNLVNIEFDEFPLKGFSLSILIKDCYRKICLTLCNLAQRAFFHFPMHNFHPFFANPGAKNTFFPHIHTLPTIQHVYTNVAPLHPTYIRICAQK
jgi:hypothetical protein